MLLEIPNWVLCGFKTVRILGGRLQVNFVVSLSEISLTLESRVLSKIIFVQIELFWENKHFFYNNVPQPQKFNAL